MPETPGSDAPRPLSRRELREARRAAGSGEAPAGDERPPAPATSPRRDDGPGIPDRASESGPVAARDTFRPVNAPSTGETAAPVPAGRSIVGGSADEPAASRSTLPDAAEAEERDESAGSLDDLFGEAEPPRRRRRGLGCLVAFLIVAVIGGGIAAGGWWAWNQYGERIMEQFGLDGPSDYEPGEATGEVIFTIEEGDTGSSISPRLHAAGVTLNEDSFYDYLIRESQSPTFYPGTYRLQERMTSEAVLSALEDPANKLEDTAQLREGLTLESSLPILADGLGMPLEELQAAVADPSAYGVAADSLEGWLFPATYTFEPGVTAQDVIGTLVNRTIESLDAAGVPEQERQRVLTIASIIEREARFEDDFYRVSRVIQNRLDDTNPETHGFLQMDSTAQYGYGEIHDGTASSSQEALEDDNPWNTYVHPGLPAGPISNPGDRAIDAAMNPADGPWLYFVTVNLDTGETVFTETYAEHQQAVAQWQEWCSANPDAGC
ncbi:endolytic transglycosylase MltG [Microbacterium sp. Marseille-Q6965]|uniref:endolytic transglycosylase MltG n=1 Tax=Microbacterium sp. Marseille-Q6965 TaxID=2965072 RepID=UPI0021B744EC|nr:endolytic transglycosylase MltG [Microbacterium sp. Marseille-Q6965]